MNEPISDVEYVRLINASREAWDAYDISGLDVDLKHAVDADRELARARQARASEKRKNAEAIISQQ